MAAVLTVTKSPARKGIKLHDCARLTARFRVADKTRLCNDDVMIPNRVVVG
jgi:hypothetical protein